MSRGLSVMDWQDIWVFLKIQVKLYKSVQTCENIILFFWRKMKDVLSQKYTWKYDIFFKCSEKIVFPKNRTGIWSFLLYYLEKWYFSPPNIWSYSLEGKWKMIFLKKIRGNVIFSSNALKRWSFQKKIPLEYDLSCIIWKGGTFFRKISFFFGQKMKDDLSQEMHGNMMFSAYMYKCYKYDITILQKKLKMIFSQKNTLKGDWHFRSHSRKSSNDSLYC